MGEKEKTKKKNSYITYELSLTAYPPCEYKICLYSLSQIFSFFFSFDIQFCFLVMDGSINTTKVKSVVIWLRHFGLVGP